MNTPRKKSPRAPSIPLDEAIERALRIYQKERRHAAPVDVAAQHLGYKSANNGAALAVLASLRYYGLVERPQEGQLAVVKDVESYQYAPSDKHRNELVIQWLRKPQIFSELLEKYEDGLPSDATLRFDLIQRGFSPASAEAVLSVFKRSVEFARYYQQTQASSDLEQASAAETQEQTIERSLDLKPEPRTPHAPIESMPDHVDTSVDRIPVRLSGGRRAWLLIPTPFYSFDKKRLKAQIDLLLTDDEEEELGTPEYEE